MCFHIIKLGPTPLHDSKFARHELNPFKYFLEIKIDHVIVYICQFSVFLQVLVLIIHESLLINTRWGRIDAGVDRFIPAFILHLSPFIDSSCSHHVMHSYTSTNRVEDVLLVVHVDCMYEEVKLCLQNTVGSFDILAFRLLQKMVRNCMRRLRSYGT